MTSVDAKREAITSYHNSCMALLGREAMLKHRPNDPEGHTNSLRWLYMLEEQLLKAGLMPIH